MNGHLKYWHRVDRHQQYIGRSQLVSSSAGENLIFASGPERANRSPFTNSARPVEHLPPKHATYTIIDQSKRSLIGDNSALNAVVTKQHAQSWKGEAACS